MARRNQARYRFLATLRRLSPLEFSFRVLFVRVNVVHVFLYDLLGKTRLKYGMRLHQEVRELSQIAEDNRQLYWFKNKLTKQNKHAKELEESLGILRHSMKMQHAQNREEVF